MTNIQSIIRGGILLGIVALSTACVVAPDRGYHEGYYDRDHHRYYHENRWHDCGDRDDHCR